MILITDITLDMNTTSNPPKAVKQVDTHRSGPFIFQVGLDLQRLHPLLNRVIDAQKRFRSMPILPDIATSLEKEILVSSIYGTNTIEAGTLSEQETAEALELDVDEVKAEEQRRVTNISSAYKIAENYAEDWANNRIEKPTPELPLIIIEDMFRNLHETITQGLSHPHNIPGQYRDNPKGLNTKVGDMEHGGVYTPPKSRDDIETLMHAFIVWINSEEVLGFSPLLRAPLAHYYFERIHPFWDGNGRVGRVIEAMILKAAGFKYAPFAMSRYYLERIDEYFAVFNIARKAEEKKEPEPNTAFVEFFLNGMLTVMNRLHDRANTMIGVLLYGNQLRVLLDNKVINDRQYTIITQLMNIPERLTVTELQRQPWYESLYRKLTDKTRRRDIQGMQDKQLIEIDENKKVRLLIPGQ